MEDTQPAGDNGAPADELGTRTEGDAEVRRHGKAARAFVAGVAAGSPAVGAVENKEGRSWGMKDS